MELLRDEFALTSKNFLKCIFAVGQKIRQILVAVPLPKDSDQLAYSRTVKHGQLSAHKKNITAITDRIRDWLSGKGFVLRRA